MSVLLYIDGVDEGTSAHAVVLYVVESGPTVLLIALDMAI
jgi:hypothetical protein